MSGYDLGLIVGGVIGFGFGWIGAMFAANLSAEKSRKKP